MAKFRALITGRYSPEVEAISEDAPSEVEICFLPQGEALGDHVSDVDIIYGHIGEGDLAKATSLRWVQVASAGVEGMMYPAFKASDIILTNSRRMHGSQIAEHAFALLLSLTRRIITQYDFVSYPALKGRGLFEASAQRVLQSFALLSPDGGFRGRLQPTHLHARLQQPF